MKEKIIIDPNAETIPKIWGTRKFLVFVSHVVNNNICGTFHECGMEQSFNYESLYDLCNQIDLICDTGLYPQQTENFRKVYLNKKELRRLVNLRPIKKYSYQPPKLSNDCNEELCLCVEILLRGYLSLQGRLQLPGHEVVVFRTAFEMMRMINELVTKMINPKYYEPLKLVRKDTVNSGGTFNGEQRNGSNEV